METTRSHQQRIDAGIGFQWDSFPPYLLEPPRADATDRLLRLRRKGKSHRGVSACTSVRELWAHSVDEAFLAEICELKELTFLHIEGTSVSDLSPLRRLSKLDRLFITGATIVRDLAFLDAHSRLSALGLEHFPEVRDLEPISSLPELVGLAFEGSVWTPGQVVSLSPLKTLARLQCLCIVNLKVADGSLRPLHELPSLQALQCANYFSELEFSALKSSKPNLECDWLETAA